MQLRKSSKLKKAAFVLAAMGLGTVLGIKSANREQLKAIRPRTGLVSTAASTVVSHLPKTLNDVSGTIKPSSEFFEELKQAELRLRKKPTSRKPIPLGQARYSRWAKKVNGRLHQFVEFNPFGIELKAISTIQPHSLDYFVKIVSKKYGNRIIAISSGGYFDLERNQSVSAIKSEGLTIARGIDLNENSSKASIVYDNFSNPPLKISHELNPKGKTVISNLVQFLNFGKFLPPKNRSIEQGLKRKRVNLAISSSDIARIDVCDNATLSDCAADLSTLDAKSAIALDSGTSSFLWYKGKTLMKPERKVKSAVIIVKRVH